MNDFEFFPSIKSHGVLMRELRGVYNSTLTSTYCSEIRQQLCRMVESNITYNQELKLDDEVDINLIYFDHDKKRLQYKFEMIHNKKKYLASTFEALALYVDLNTRKVKEFEENKAKIMDDFIIKNKSNFNTEDLKLSSKLKK